MAFRKGDRISIGMNPSLKLSDYNMVKPFAAASRELGDDPEADLETLRTDLEEEFGKVLLQELGMWAGMVEALEEGGVEGLINYAKELTHVEIKQEEGNTRKKQKETGNGEQERKVRKKRRKR